MTRFYTWLQTHAKNPTAIGDLARDAKRDSSFPKRTTSFREAYEHLCRLGACTEALETLKEAWLGWGGELDYDPDEDEDEDEAEDNEDEDEDDIGDCIHMNLNDPNLRPDDGGT